MKKLKIGIVGCGAIGSTLAKLIQKRFSRKIQITSFCDIDVSRAKELSRQVKGARVSSLDRLIQSCDLVVEAASAKVSFDVAQKALKAKKDALIMSVGGVLGKEKRLFALAKRNGASVFFPSGAICGLDGIRALALSKIERITLTTTKPPESLKGADYLLKHGISVEDLSSDKVVFEGTAYEAVRAFPQNINVVAVLSLAALGQVVPSVKIVASPSSKKNVHLIDVDSKAAHLNIRCENVPSPDNSKTSFLAVLSAMATIVGILDPVKVGT